MHASVMQFVERKVKQRGLGRLAVLDVGSLSVNGNVRHMFGDGYVGVDMRPGKNVDRVVNAHDLVREFGEGAFDAVLSLEMLEHDDAFWISMDQMGRVLRPGGTLIVTTRGIGFPKHDHPHDYWRFTMETAPVLCRLAGAALMEVTEDQPSGILVEGRKAP